MFGEVRTGRGERSFSDGDRQSFLIQARECRGVVMGRVEINKKNKEEALYRKGFQLFVDKGFVKTTISDIVKAAGLAKGTFYLYFKDKYDLRDRLIARHSGQILREAREHLQKHPVEGFENQLLVIIDYIMDYMEKNTMVLKFINKNISWGIFEDVINGTAPEETREVYDALLELMERDHVVCEKPELMLSKYKPIRQIH